MPIEQAAVVLGIDLDEAEDLCSAIGADPLCLSPDDLEEMASMVDDDEDE